MLALDISEFFSDHPNFLTPSLVLIKTSCTPMGRNSGIFVEGRRLEVSQTSSNVSGDGPLVGKFVQVKRASVASINVAVGPTAWAQPIFV